MDSAPQVELEQAEIQMLLKKKTITLETPVEGQLISYPVLIPKKSGELRPIINIRPLNNFVLYQHFKMEGVNLHVVTDLLNLGDIFGAKLTSRTPTSWSLFTWNIANTCVSVGKTVCFSLLVSPSAYQALQECLRKFSNQSLHIFIKGELDVCFPRRHPHSRQNIRGMQGELEHNRKPTSEVRFLDKSRQVSFCPITPVNWFFSSIHRQ